MYRAQTGVGLAEAKAAVEALDRGESAPPHADAPAPPEVDALLWESLKSGRKIDAIKRYRELTGCGLRDAKEAVEGMAREHGIVVSGRGCAGAIFLGLAAAATTVWLLV